MKNTIQPTETTFNILEELEPVIKDFLKHLGLSLSQTTCIGEKRILDRFFTHMHLAKKHYKTIFKEDIEAYVITQQWSQHTRAHALYTIRRFYEHLKVKHIVEFNPAEKIKIVYPKKQHLTQVPTLAEIKGVFRKLEKNKTATGLRNQLMIELAYGSGLRAGEIATLNIEDINITNQTAHVLGKGRKERVVPLTKRCMAALQKYFRTIKEPRKPLFIQTKGKNMGQRLKPPSVSSLIRNKTRFHAHLYRHACATHMLLAGCNIRYIQELLGHERTDTTQIYTRFRNEELRQVINKKHPCAKRIISVTYMNMKS
ncbi:MAG: tyrosine-type recombinase/integrase [Candidatus Omnitrophica bacterium]|nr:tyrosine-type recombinase/integrase [Candidatus Omnitrophota bacterium]